MTARDARRRRAAKKMGTSGWAARQMSKRRGRRPGKRSRRTANRSYGYKKKNRG